MAKFIDTDAGETFILSAASRETSPEIMKAIAFFAKDDHEAEALWNGDAFDSVAHLSDIWEHATSNGIMDAESLYWGGRKLSVIMKDERGLA